MQRKESSFCELLCLSTEGSERAVFPPEIRTLGALSDLVSMSNS